MPPLEQGGNVSMIVSVDGEMGGKRGRDARHGWDVIDVGVVDHGGHCFSDVALAELVFRVLFPYSLGDVSRVDL